MPCRTADPRGRQEAGAGSRRRGGGLGGGAPGRRRGGRPSPPEGPGGRGAAHLLQGVCVVCVRVRSACLKSAKVHSLANLPTIARTDRFHRRHTDPPSTTSLPSAVVRGQGERPRGAVGPLLARVGWLMLLRCFRAACAFVSKVNAQDTPTPTWLETPRTIPRAAASVLGGPLHEALHTDSSLKAKQRSWDGADGFCGRRRHRPWERWRLPTHSGATQSIFSQTNVTFP
jgi:hypothetical protein